MGGLRPCRFLDSGSPTRMVPPTPFGDGRWSPTRNRGVSHDWYRRRARVRAQQLPLPSFQFDTHAVRVVLRDGEPWFVAADICAALGIANSRMAVEKLDEDERGVSSIDTPSQNQHGSFGMAKQSLQVVSESGLYTLIMRCRGAVRPGSVPHRFRKWVTGEVLPAIRRKDEYIASKQPAGAIQPVPGRIDPAGLLMAETFEPIVELPPVVSQALEQRAWQLTGEAYVLIREHLRRRVAGDAERGQPREIDVEAALRAIQAGDLGSALAHTYLRKLDWLRGLAEHYRRAAHELVDELDRAADEDRRGPHTDRGA